MRKMVVLAITAMVLSGISAQAAENESSMDVRLSVEDIAQANMMESILANYSNVSVEQRNFLSAQSYSSCYMSQDSFWWKNEESEVLVADGKYYVYGADEEEKDYLAVGYHLDETQVLPIEIYPSMVNLDPEYGEAVSVSQEGGLLDVLIRMDPEYTKIYYSDNPDSVNEGEYIEYEVRLDADTYALRTMEEYLIQNDGYRWLLYYTTYEYNMEAPQAISDLQNRITEEAKAADGTRTFTAVVDPGTAEEVVHTFTIPKGQYIFMMYDYDSYGEYMDEAGTIPASEAESDYNADETIYYIKK